MRHYTARRLHQYICRAQYPSPPSNFTKPPYPITMRAEQPSVSFPRALRRRQSPPDIRGRHPAIPAHAWHYISRRPMLSTTPPWIIGTYGVRLLAIASCALVFYRKRAWGRTLLGDFVIGTVLLFASVLWFSLLGQ